ncbi:MAG: low molecular weight phosphotyrosine protein phosphatase [Bacteroidetes bacterium]|nr:MAG: low molecular weight phosphotyrosine protein phosphatase [Bacteroidota bacterium]
MNVLFVCTGNICRSPLAEGILRKKYTKRGIRSRVDSCGFEPFHIGDSPDHRAQKIARVNGIDISSHSARLFRPDDFDRFDRIFVMEAYHYQAVMRHVRHEEDIRKIDFIRNVVYPGQNRPVNDPYYDQIDAFEIVFAQLEEACEQFVHSLSLKKRS